MTHFSVVDRIGRRWSVFAGPGGAFRARSAASEVELTALIASAWPVVMSGESATAGHRAALADTIDLVASDPATATVEQIAMVARFAQAIVSPKRD